MQSDQRENFSAGRNSEEPDSLRQYYRQLSDSEPLSSEAEYNLWVSMEQVRNEIRSKIYRMGFVMSEHIKLYRGMSPDDAAEFFSVGGETAAPLLLDQWIREIERTQKKMCDAFAAGKKTELEKLRNAVVTLLSRYPVALEKLREWYKVAEVYQARMKESGSDAEELKRKLLLEPEDFESLMQSLQDGFARMEELRQRLLTANLRLVVSIVKPFRKSSVQTGDLIQEGNIGLVRAMERFDYRRGHKFSTYATWWIKQSISKAVASQSRIIRLPAHMLNTISRINRAERDFIQRNGRNPSVEELSAVLEMPRERVSAIRKMASQSLSLQAPLTEDEDSPTFEQYLCTEEEDSPLRMLAFKFLQDRLGKAMEHLTEREQQIITLHFGLSGKKSMSLLELSELFGLTRERIRQIELRALRKLREPGIASEFKDYFF